MAGSYPTSPEPSHIELIYHQPTIVDLAESGRRQARIGGGHLWKFKLKYDMMLRSQFAPIYAFCVRQRARLDNFTFVPEHLSVPLGVATGTPQVANVHSVGDTLIQTDGWTGSVTGIMKAGDIVKFANHDKVYMIVSDVNSLVGGQAVLPIDPPLVEALVATEGITVNDVPFTVALDGDIITWRAQAPSLSAYTVNFVEHIA